MKYCDHMTLGAADSCIPLCGIQQFPAMQVEVTLYRPRTQDGLRQLDPVHAGFANDAAAIDANACREQCGRLCTPQSWHAECFAHMVPAPLLQSMASYARCAVLDEMVEACQALGIRLCGLLHEFTHSQYEVVLHHTEALQARPAPSQLSTQCLWHALLLVQMQGTAGLHGPVHGQLLCWSEEASDHPDCRQQHRSCAGS